MRLSKTLSAEGTDSLKDGREIVTRAHYYYQCVNFLRNEVGIDDCFVVGSATVGLESCFLALDLERGIDEVVVPSFTFSSTANAIVLAGGVPVFCDIYADTLNMSAESLERSISERTRAIALVHYAGGVDPRQLERVLAIAQKYRLLLVEDAAQALGSKVEGRSLGTFGDLGVYSFHYTKNLSCGEGGAIVVSNRRLVRNLELVLEKGTDRTMFTRGEVDFYTWQTLGVSAFTSELVCKDLAYRLPLLGDITSHRRKIWNSLVREFSKIENYEKWFSFIDNKEYRSNGHFFFLVMRSDSLAKSLIRFLRSIGVAASSHYVPLHSSPAGVKWGRVYTNPVVSTRVHKKLVRIPISLDSSEIGVGELVSKLRAFLCESDIRGE